MSTLTRPRLTVVGEPTSPGDGSPAATSSPRDASGTGRRWPSWTPYGLILVVGSVLQIVFIGRNSFWLDESVSATLATARWHRFAELVTHRESNMVLYYALLRPWSWLGHSEAALRSLSVIFGIGALALVMVVTHQLFGRRAAVITGLLFAVNPLVVQYAQDARGYALSIFLVTASTGLFVAALRRPAARWAWVAYVVVTALAAYTNFWAALVPVAQAVSLAFWNEGPLPWRKLAYVATGLFVLLVPMGILVHAANSGGVGWVASSAGGRVFTSVRAHVPHGAIDLLVLVGLAVAVWVVVALKRNARTVAALSNWPAMLIVCWAVVPVALLVLLSLVFEPLLVLRYLMVCLPPVVILVGVALARMARRAAAVALVVLVALSGVGLAQWYSHGMGQNWRGATAYLAAHGRTGDGVMIFAPYVRIPVEWYLVQHPGATSRLHPVYPSLAWGKDPLYFDGYIRVDESEVARGARGDHRVWVVLGQAQLYPQQYQAVVAGLSSDGLALTSRRSFAGVEVDQYVTHASPTA